MFVGSSPQLDQNVATADNHQGWYQAIFEHAADLVIVLDGDGTRRFVSPSVTRILGYAMDEYLALPTFELVHPDDLEETRRTHLECLRQPGPQPPVRYRVRHQDGTWRSIESIRSNLIADPAVNGIVVTSRDITESEEARERLKRSESQFRSAFTSTSIGMALIDLGGRWLSVNQVVRTLTGKTESDLIGNAIAASLHPDDRAVLTYELEQLCLPDREQMQTELRFERGSGDWNWVQFSAAIVRTEDSSPLHIIGQMQDITARRAAEQTLRDSEARFRALLANAADIVLLLDSSGRVRWASPSVSTLLGFEPGALIGQSNVDLVHRSDRADLRRSFVQVARHPGEASRTTLRFKHRDGSYRWLESVAANHLANPAIAGVVVNARDVSDRVELEERLRQDALHDPLTGLANRAMFDDQVRRNLSSARRHGFATAILFIDLDGFKPINDTLGHAYGDQVLQLVGRRLQANLRPNDVVARMGGDEFAVALERLDSSTEIDSIVERMRSIFRLPIPVSGTQVSVGASIGWAISDGGFAEVDALIAEADAAMYTVKRSLHAAGHNGR